eukprot:scaffold746_cov508-Prasinococcus_capsulatus_cf.AAC.9
MQDVDAARGRRRGVRNPTLPRQSASREDTGAADRIRSHKSDTHWPNPQKEFSLYGIFESCPPPPRGRPQSSSHVAPVTYPATPSSCFVSCRTTLAGEPRPAWAEHIWPARATRRLSLLLHWL